MTTPTCWYCLTCGRIELRDFRGPEARGFHWDSDGEACIGTAHEVPLLVPGVDLPAALREAGYDVREGWWHDASDDPDFPGWWADANDDPIGDPSCLVVVLPDGEAT